ncbi:hypothetical protein AMK18_21690 [Streptomyces sp. CB01249]|uniref:glycosyltransferase n=1 Tax=Streptomyces sp. CB01249 TaxID=1703929 RepID=UPI00093A3A02|nr:glycosyltransferase [Streptomyces sp. CB01249]OKI99707.1 hypothetical protein AMK18_21690 [Streptomyces sp. CB01249]
MKVSIGIFAHNEEHTVGRAIEAMLAQEPEQAKILEIFVLSCASTDSTVAAAEAYARHDARLTVVNRPKREGKLAAINDFLARATGDVLVIAGADLVVAPGLVERLVEPMRRDPRCGMTGPRIATHGTAGLTGRMHDLLWRMHHEIASMQPKLGEVVALRREFVPEGLPTGIHCDEVVMEAEVIRRGGLLAYVSEAEVRNFPPSDVREFYGQRRRIACQHRAADRRLSYRPATLRKRNVVRAALNVVREDPGRVLTLASLCGVELAARMQGAIDERRGRTYQVWSPVLREVRVNATQPN